MPILARRTVRRHTRCVLAHGLYSALVVYLTPTVIDTFVRECRHVFRERFYPPLLVLWGMISQALSHDSSDRAAIHRLAGWFGRDLSPGSGSYCKARKHLPLALLEAATRYVASITAPCDLPLGKRRVFVLDGSAVTLADTYENQQLYPQPTNQKPGCGFPVLRFVALMDHATGCIVEMLFGSLHIHDARLARPLWDRLHKGDILLADRGFAGYGLLARQHQAQKNVTPFPGQVDDSLEWWSCPKETPDWWGIEGPERLHVRVIRKTLPDGSVLTLNTTLSAKHYPARILCDLYRSRWRVETMFGDLKTTLGLDETYPKTPATAYRRVWAHALAYNLMCCLLADVAATYGVPRNRLSLKGAADALTAGLGLRVTTLLEAWEWVADRVARDLLPDRPDRVEPRVLKRRPKPFPWLTKHRRLLRNDPNARGRPKR
jgi:hypothetical protein